MKHAILSVILLVAAVWLGVWLGHDRGMVLIAWQHATLETPLWFALVLLAVLVFLVWQLARLLSGLGHVVTRFRHWQLLRIQSRACRRTAKGLTDLMEHRWARAEQHLAESAQVPGLQAVNYMGAALAAHRLHALVRRDTWLARAERMPAAKLLAADFALADGQPEKALALLSSLDPQNPAVLIRLQKVYRHLHKWDALLKVIPFLQKHHLISAQRAGRLERKTVSAWLEKAARNGTAETLATFKKLPRRLQEDPRLIRLLVLSLRHDPDQQVWLAKLLSAALERQFDPVLVKLYGSIHLPDHAKQLRHAEQWLATHSSHSALLLTLGRLSLRCQLWGKARGYFSDCLKKGRKYHAEALAGLGQLDEQAGDLRHAVVHYRESVEKSETGMI